jgi:phospholipase C
VLVAALVAVATQVITPGSAAIARAPFLADPATTTPIKHVVVIFDENVSFDHYFGTYPYAANTDGTPFTADPATPTVDTELSAGLIPSNQQAAHNPAASLTPNPNAFQPARLSQAHAMTCDQNHSYGPEQSAVHGGAMDNFVATSSAAGCATGGQYGVAGLSMDYFDGNTVTGLWNYAQNYAMSDNNWDAVFGPSTPGALNVASGNTYSGTTTISSDPDPNGDSFGSAAAATKPTMAGANIGDLLNRKAVSWGWFQGGFASKTAKTTTVTGAASLNYSAHHNPFEYYASTANKAHTAPVDGNEVGHAGRANHEYDLSVFNAALSNTAINGVTPDLPAVSYVKAPQAQDGHAGYSDPLDEQEFLTGEINKIQQSAYWPSTAIIVTYDDSDGWYDHVAPTITNSSVGATGDTAICTAGGTANELGGHNGRCGPSQRLPLLVISPYAKKNYVSHVLTNQASVLKFIETNWSTGTIDPISSVKGSFDAGAANLDDLFDWVAPPQANEVLLDSTKYKPGATTCAGKSDYSTCINPNFGAVTSTPPALPVISLKRTTFAVPFGTSLSSAAVLSSSGAKINRGALSAVSLTGVNTKRVGSYTVTIAGGDGAVAAAPKHVVIQVKAIASRAALKISPHKVKVRKTVTVTVTVSAPGARSGTTVGKVVLYQRSKALKTLAVRNGRATIKLKLAKGKHPIHAKYFGNPAWGITASLSNAVTITVVKR